MSNYENFMTMENQRCWLFLGTDGSSAAICQEMSRKFDLVIKVLNRRVTPSVRLNALELQGAKNNIDKAVWWLKRRGIQIDAGELPTAEAKV